MSDTARGRNPGFETLALHAGQVPDPPPTPAPCPSTRPPPTSSTTPTMPPTSLACGVRQHLHAHHESHERRVRAAGGSAGGRRRRAGLRSGSAAVTFGILNIAAAGDNIVSRQQPVRRHLQPLRCTRCPASASTIELVDPPTRRTSAARSSPTPSCSMPRPWATPSSTRSTSRRSPRSRTRPASRSSSTTRWHAVPHPAHRPRRRHRGALRDQVHRRTWHVNRRRGRRLRQVRLGAERQVPGSRRARRELPRVQVLRGARADRVYRQAARAACCATSARRFRRSTPSSSCRAWRRCRCAWSATAPTRWPWPAPGEAPEGRLGAAIPGLRVASRPTRPRRSTSVTATARSSASASRAVEAGRRFIESTEAVLASGQHRRRQVAGHPPGDDDALAAQPERTARDRRQPRLRPAQRRHRAIDDILADIDQALAGDCRTAGRASQGALGAATQVGDRGWPADRKHAARKEIGDVAMGLGEDAGNAGIVHTRA